MKKAVLAGLVVISLISCHKKEIANADDTQKQFVLSDTMAKMIQIDTVSLCNIDNALTLSGEINFDENSVVKVFPRSSGQVLESRVTLGDKVQRGQVLAVIKSADVAGGYADLSGAEADINIAKREMENEQALYNNGIASEKDFAEAKQNYQKALAEKEKIQSSLNITGNTKPGGTYIITSPITGYVVEKNINAGSFIRPDNADNLFTVSDLKDVWVWANVFEPDISKVKEGNDVDITTLAYPDKVFHGVIDKVSEVLDPQDKAMKVRVRLPNPDGLLKPQMFARVLVSSEQKEKALCIPSSAIISEDGKDYVIVYNSRTDLKVQEVSVLKVVGDRTYLKTGLSEGQKVVTRNQILLYNALNEVL